MSVPDKRGFNSSGAPWDFDVQNALSGTFLAQVWVKEKRQDAKARYESNNPRKFNSCLHLPPPLFFEQPIFQQPLFTSEGA